jgi:8-oxo-dGTP diphosphatase
VRDPAPERLGFDHDRILDDGIERARARLEYTTLATAFCPPEFTIAEPREAYESIWDEQLDPRNLSRKVLSTDDFVVPTSASTTRGGGRPARLYRAGRPPNSRHRYASGRVIPRTRASAATAWAAC